MRYEDPGTLILSRQAEFGYGTGRIRFEGAKFSLGSSSARGAADALEINENGTLSLGGVEYTTCPPDSEDWLLQGESIVLDTGDGVGTAKNMKLRFKNVPILYLPHISFPISDARKSGILTPEIGSSGRSGNEIRVPYYWNIAPNYDATITPRLLTSRGLQLAANFRYLTERNEGGVTADYLSNDRHRQRFASSTAVQPPHLVGQRLAQPDQFPRGFGQPVFRGSGRQPEYLQYHAPESSRQLRLPLEAFVVLRASPGLPDD